MRNGLVWHKWYSGGWEEEWVKDPKAINFKSMQCSQFKNFKKYSDLK